MDFYSTSAQVIATLMVALVVEDRLFEGKGSYGTNAIWRYLLAAISTGAMLACLFALGNESKLPGVVDALIIIAATIQLLAASLPIALRVVFAPPPWERDGEGDDD